jgi:hypothetical protein
MITKVQKIVLLGRSEKFNNIVRHNFKGAEIVVIPWRTSIQSLRKPDLNGFLGADLILVCGYDYSSSSYDYDRYMNVNVTTPLDLIKAIASPATFIIYIDTLHGAVPFTLSRYQYAKQALGIALRRQFKHLAILNVPSIVNEDGKVDVQGGVITKLIFNSLNKAGILKTITTAELGRMLPMALSNQSHRLESLLGLKSRFLRVRRTLFLDRLLRFICG